jgi:hypothetical protein
MDNIFDFDSGYDAGSQLELDNYNEFGYEEIPSWMGGSVDAVTGEWSSGLNESNSGTNAESMAGWKYSNGKWTDPSGKTYNLNAPGLMDKLKASGLAKYAGAAGLGALINSLMNQGGGGGGSSAKIPQLMASRQQYAVPLTSPRSTYNPTDDEIRNYVSRPGMTDAMVVRGMNQFGVTPQRMSGITGLPVENVQSRYQAAMGPNALSRRPGSGGVTYFSPMQYSPVGSFTTTAPVETPVETPETIVAAGGGMMRGGGISDLGGYSDGGRLLRGPGDGVSDSIPASINNKQPARLADGEFVVPARIVSELGNGSTEAGARKLYAMMDRIQKSRRKAKNIAANTRADKHLPA